MIGSQHREELDGIVASPDGQLARSSPQLMQTLNDRLIPRRDDETRAAEQLRALCALVYHLDHCFLHDVKMALRDGVRVWEEHEANTIAAGGSRLLQSIGHVPRLLGDYYGRIAAELRAFGLTGVDVNERVDALPQPRDVPRDMVGHGTVAVVTHQQLTEALGA